MTTTTIPTQTIRGSLGSAFAVLSSALRFFGRNYLVVFAFGIIASAQRFVMVLDVDSRVGVVSGPIGDQATQFVRFLFFLWAGYMIVWKSRPPRGEMGALVKAFFRRRALMLVWSGLILLVLVLVLGLGVDLVGRTVFGSEPLYDAVQLAIKNVTIIPFITAWFLSIVRFAIAGPPAGVTQLTGLAQE